MVARRLEALRTLTEPYQKRQPVDHEVLTGTGFLEIIRAVLRNGYDRVLKAAENPSFVERLFGSDDMHLLRKCPCPIWLTTPGEKSNYARILAAVDFDPEAMDTPADLSREILELATSLALSDFAELHVIHVWDAPAESTIRAWSDDPNASLAYVEGERTRHERGFDRLHVQLKEKIGAEAYAHLAPRFHLRKGKAATLIPQVASEVEADLVVMGTVGRTGIPGLFIGNTAEAVLEQLQSSVLAVKPAGFVSPVTLPAD
jgi:nucleotide-binding universal stress UspA family protein